MTEKDSAPGAVDPSAIKEAAESAPRKRKKAAAKPPPDPKVSPDEKKKGPGRPKKVPKRSEQIIDLAIVRPPPSPEKIQQMLDGIERGLASLAQAATLYVSVTLKRPRVPQIEDCRAFAGAVVDLGALYLPEKGITAGQAAAVAVAATGFTMIARADVVPLIDAPAPVKPDKPSDLTQDPPAE